MIICKNCKEIMSYNSYFGGYYCPNCGQLDKDIKKEGAMLSSPFVNDPFSIVYQAFTDLFPEIKCKIQWNPWISTSNDKSYTDNSYYGCTTFEQNGNILVDISTDITVEDAIEILAHELAHVASGANQEHDTVWEDNFDKIYKQYNIISERMLNK